MKLNEATVLVVEDEPQIRNFFRIWFESAGCRLLEAENGLQGLELVRQHRFDFVVSDVRMPVMDGIALARNIKAMPGYCPKILFISGYADITDRDAYDLGVEVTLAKPIARKQLMPVVERCLADLRDRWAEPPALKAPRDVLAVRYESLTAAEAQGLIAFGRGGFCIHAPLVVVAGDTVGLQITFAAEEWVLKGTGIVRWAAADEAMIGVEIASVGPDAAEWLAGHCLGSTSNAFIPRTSRQQGVSGPE